MIRTKLLGFKPLKSGEVTIYVEGLTLPAKHQLMDMEGQEIDIELAVGKVINELDEATKVLFSLIQDFGNQQYIHGRESGLEIKQEAEKGTIKELEI